MKNLIISILTVFSLTQCDDSGLENSPADLLIGSWKNVANETTIEFDRNSNYTVKFDLNTSFSCAYHLSTLKEDNKLYIQVAHVTYEVAYQFLGNNKLKLTRINPPSLSDTYDDVIIYDRLN